MTSLVSPVAIGRTTAPHRIAMAPMTRRRADPGGVPGDLMVRYFAQRADAALIVTDGTLVSPDRQRDDVPGLVDDAQQAGWQRVVGAVHAAGGRIAVQLWVAGRLSRHPHGLPVSPSAPVPDDLVPARIEAFVDEFRAAAARAVAAGFDAVEIHCANGSLLDEFLRTSANHRDDAYGGDRVGRSRFVLDVVDAVAAEVGADRVGVRVAPHVAVRTLSCPEIVDTIVFLAGELTARRVAYLHLAEADWAEAPKVDDAFRTRLRTAFPGTILAAGEYTLPKALRVLDAGFVDVVAFGRAFIANPDLPTRMIAGLPLAEPDLTTIYTGGPEGYVTYPRHGAAQARTG